MYSLQYYQLALQRKI